jgi:phospholipid/cholesterol/gamma-HCH transport system ATP-binding protein
MAYGDKVIQRDLSFDVRRGEVFAIIGGSGTGKSTLLRHLIGLQAPTRGQVLFEGRSMYPADGDTAVLEAVRRQCGVAFQSGALWSSMTVGENVMLPLRKFKPAPQAELAALARRKLAQVGLEDAFDREPAALSGGMRKRAAIARAMALDPPLLYLDEPSAGLDPITAARLDELILALREREGTTVVLVTHDLPSIFAVADRALFLDAQEKTMTALGPPDELLHHGPAPVQLFLRRGRSAQEAAQGAVA